MFIGSPPLTLSRYTNLDSEDNAMLPAHAYKAQSAGFVTAYQDCPAGSGRAIRGFVGLTSNPEGAGDKIQDNENDGSTFNNYRSIGFEVAKNEYFEVTVYSGTPVIRWKSYGPLKKPVDYN